MPTREMVSEEHVKRLRQRLSSTKSQAQACVPQVSSTLLLKGIDMALSKKKRVGKRTISAKQVKKVASGRKRRKSDGTQPSKVVFPTSAPAAT